MKKIICAIAFVVASVTAFAVKPTVFIEDFTNPNNTKNAWVVSIRGAVLDGLQKSGRVTIVDAVTEKSRFDEEMRRIKGNLDTSDISTTEALKTKGAHYILTGDVTSVAIKEDVAKKDDGTTYKTYEASASYTLKVVNAADGSMLMTETYTIPNNIAKGLLNSFTKGVAESEDAAVNNLLGDVSGSMNKFSNLHYS